MLKRIVSAIRNWGSTAKAATGRAMAVGALRFAMSQGNPGGWASDHREETNQYSGWHYVAARAIALQCSQAQVNVYQDKASRTKAYTEQDDQGEPLPASHSLCRLLKRPSPKQSGASFRYEASLQLSLTGTCLIWNVPNKLGKPVERYVIPTAIATPMRPSEQYPRGYWKVQPESAYYGAGDGWSLMGNLSLLVNNELPAEQVQVIRWPHPLYRDDGQSPVAAGALWTDTATMVDKARWFHMQNGPSPSLAVTAPEGWDGEEAELDRAASKFNEKYAGTKNHGKAIFLAGGSVTPLTQSAEEMDYQNAFIQLRDAILAIHGTPGVAAGVTDGGSYAAFYAALLQFTTLTVQPQLSLIAEEETEQLAVEFGEGLTVEMLAKPIDDPTVLENQLKTDLAGAIRTRDEYRLLRGLPAVGGEKGEEFVGGAVVGAAMAQADKTESTTGLLGVPRIGISGSPMQQAVAQGSPAKPSDGLNGAQITAAVEMLANVQAGALAPEAATMLMVELGIPNDKARAILSAQMRLPDPEPIAIGTDAQTPQEEEEKPALSKSRFANNGHSNGHFKGYP